MTIRAKPKTFSPSSLSDAEDGGSVFPGACAALVNLIPKPSTRNLWVPRPAKTVMTRFPGFVTPGFVSAMKVIGTRVYGMIATGRNAGKDEPFIYDIEAGTFVTVAGVTNVNSPVSPASSGAWTPPTMDLIGVYLVVTHPGYNGTAGNFFGWFDLTNPAAPIWNAGNTSGAFLLTSVPVAVANFNGRAYFAMAEYAVFTDPLTLNITAGDQAISFGDNVPVTAFKGLGLNTELGGIVQALIVFKGLSSAWQVKGDKTSNDLRRDILNYAVGTESPNSLVDTPYGVALLAPDGLRFIGLGGAYTPIIGGSGDGVNVPFLNALVPSRSVMSCNASVLRAVVQNGGIAGTPVQEYWLHLNREPKVWSGPHTFVASLMEAYKTKFIVAPVGDAGALYMSETVPSTTTTYDEMGAQIQWQMSTVMLPDEGFDGVYNFNEMTINMALDPVMISFNVYILNPNNVQYDSVVELVTGSTPIWDAAVWDSDIWDGSSQGLTPRRIDWTKDITTSRAQIVVTGGAAGAVIIGDMRFMKGEYQYVPKNGI